MSEPVQFLRRKDHPDTSHASAETVQSAKFEALALEIHLEAGLNGCILDDLRREFEKRAPANTQFVNRRTGLHRKGLVLDTGTRRMGEAGKLQAVYVAASLLTEQWLEYIKKHPLAHNPCLNPESTLREHEADSKARVRKYLLYVGRDFYPGAVNEDLVCSADNIEELLAEVEQRTDPDDQYEWWAIVRHATMQIVDAKRREDK